MVVPEGRRLAFGFPGVGVRLCGREVGFFESNASLMGPHLEAASDAAGEDLAAALSAGRIEDLSDEKQQYFTFGFGLGASLVFEEMGARPSCAAGYSFGIYAALCSAGALSAEDGIRAFARAFELMAEASEGIGYSMGITVGLGDEEIHELIEGAGPSVRRVNSNNETCHVFSGEATELDDFLAAASSHDAFAADRLPVRVPYHHPVVLAEASRRFADFLETLDWRTPRCPVISSIDQAMVSSARGLAKMAAANLSTPISWRLVIEALDDLGYSKLLECGPGISLTQNGRFSKVSLDFANIRNHARKGVASNE